MITKENIDKFLAAKSIAVVGVSGSGKKFGAMVYRDLKNKGRAVCGVNPKGGAIDGDPLYASLTDVPEKPQAAVIVVPPKIALVVVKEAQQSGVKNIWLQPGAESDDAVQFCRDHNLNVIHGECILMHADPVASIHKFHRFINTLFGKLPS